MSALLVGRDSSWPALIAGFVVCGLGVGLATPTLSSTAMGAVSPDRGGMAAGAVNTARQLGFAFGIAVLGSVFESRAAHRLQLAGVAGSSKLASALAGGQAKAVVAAAPGSQRGQLVGAVHAAFASGLDTVFVVAGVAGLVAGVTGLLLVRRFTPTPASAPASAPVPTSRAAVR